MFVGDSTFKVPSFREIFWVPKNKGLNENPTYGSGSSLRMGVLTSDFAESTEASEIVRRRGS
jgi:hypothetical protein